MTECSPIDRSRLRTLKDSPVAKLVQALDALSEGRPLERLMTSEERLLVSITATAPPTHSLTLHSAAMSREEIRRAWPCFRKRIERELGVRLIYVATVARSREGGGGFHVHALLWNGYIHWTGLHRHGLEAGFGRPHIEQIPTDPGRRADQARMVGYSLSQHQPVFGSSTHERHDPREPGQRPFMMPQRATLHAHAPRLLSALDTARDPMIADLDLGLMLPRFSRYTDAPQPSRPKAGTDHADHH